MVHMCFLIKEFKKTNLDSDLDFENWGVISSYVYGLKHFLPHQPLWESSESCGLHSQKNAQKHIHKILHNIDCIALEVFFLLFENHKKVMLS